MTRYEILGQILILNDSETFLSTSLNPETRKKYIAKKFKPSSFEKATFFSFSHLGLYTLLSGFKPDFDLKCCESQNQLIRLAANRETMQEPLMIIVLEEKG
jgi:hypothetical protein